LHPVVDSEVVRADGCQCGAGQSRSGASAAQNHLSRLGPLSA